MRWKAMIKAAIASTACIGLSNMRPVAAFEYQNGAGITCDPSQSAVASALGYGDSNLYSTWGKIAESYDIPYNQSTYLWNYVHMDGRHYTYATAADAENYVDSVGPGCDTKKF